MAHQVAGSVVGIVSRYGGVGVEIDAGWQFRNAVCSRVELRYGRRRRGPHGDARASCCSVPEGVVAVRALPEVVVFTDRLKAIDGESGAPWGAYDAAEGQPVASKIGRCPLFCLAARSRKRLLFFSERQLSHFCSVSALGCMP